TGRLLNLIADYPAGISRLRIIAYVNVGRFLRKVASPSAAVRHDMAGPLHIGLSGQFVAEQRQCLQGHTNGDNRRHG
ncbi:MAG: hypothetical protein PVF93_11840, partial [Chromatiaceae bacterium]